MDSKMQIAVVGATGVVGREILGALLHRGVRPEQLTALASERSEGEEVEYGEETLEVERAAPDSFRGMKLVLFATPADVSRQLAPAAQAAGAWAVDVSQAFSRDPTVPLVLPGVNGAQLKKPFKGRIVGVPAAATTGLCTLLEPLWTLLPRRAVTCALLSASASGTAGISELERQTAALLSGRDVEAVRFPHRLAFNLIPQVGELAAGADLTSEEAAWAEQAGRLWEGREQPALFWSAIQVPTFYGHAFSILLELAKASSVEELRGALGASRAIKLLDVPGEKVYPMPMLITGDPALHVGRIRAVDQGKGLFSLFAVLDNAGRGAGLTAVEVGLELAGRADG